MNHKNILTGVMFAVALIGFTGCSADVTGTLEPGINIRDYKSMHIIRTEQTDASDAMGTALLKRGFVVTKGPRDAGKNSDCLVTIHDKWMWDITMYLLELKVDITETKTGKLVGSGRSYRTSMARKSPEVMADELTEAMFGSKAK